MLNPCGINEIGLVNELEDCIDAKKNLKPAQQLIDEVNKKYNEGILNREEVKFIFKELA